MVSRKRRWEDSDSDDQEEEVAPDPRPAKRLFNSGLTKVLRRPFQWMAKQLSSLWGSVDEQSPDPRTVTVGMALPAAGAGAGAPNGDSVDMTTTGASAPREHTIDPNSPLTGAIFSHRRHGHLLSSSASKAVSSPNGSVAPPFHFSPSPVGRRAAYSALLTASANAPRRPAAHSVGSVSSSPVMAPTQPAERSSPNPEPPIVQPPTPANARPANARPANARSASNPMPTPAMAAAASSASSSSVSLFVPLPSRVPVASAADGVDASLATAAPSVRSQQTAGFAPVVRKPRYPSSSLSCDAVRLKERDRYRRLLDQFTSPPSRRRGYTAGGNASTASVAVADTDPANPSALFVETGGYGYVPAHPSYPGDHVYVNDISADDFARNGGGCDGDSDVVITSAIAGNRARVQQHQHQPYDRIVSSPYGFEPADPQIAVTSPSPRPCRQRPGVRAPVFQSPMLRQNQQQPRSASSSSHYRARGSSPSRPLAAGPSGGVASTARSAGLATVASPPDGVLAPGVARYHEVAHRTPANDVRVYSVDGDDDTEESAGDDDAPGRGARDSPAAHVFSPAAPRSWAKVSASSAIKKAAGTDWISNLCTEVDRTIKESQQRTDVLERHLQTLRLQREEKEYTASEKLKERLASVRQRTKDLKLVDAPLIDEPEEETLPELSDEQENMVTSALKSGNKTKVLSSAFNIDMTRGDVATLNGSGWLNDEVINFFFQMIKARNDANEDLPSVHVMSSFFYPKLVDTGYATIRRWTRKVDIFSKDLVAVPIHLGMHWCVAMIDFRSKAIVYYDSLLGNNQQCLTALRNYLKEESKDKRKVEFDMSDWKLEQAKDIPEQMNGCDCGVFACTYAAYLARDMPFNFSQDDMQYFRRRMVYEILSKQLMI